MNRNALLLVAAASVLVGCSKAAADASTDTSTPASSVQQGDGYTLKKIPRDKPPTPATRVPGSKPGDGVTPNYDTPLPPTKGSGDSPKPVTPAPAGDQAQKTAGAK
jgi:hypothetical protein